ncbi:MULTISPECIES: hypothetical protein [unclassified Streptomyces]|uniref:hypothetical protein n=1 Tax=unclassified Streptomyces TaxID=2593676 RepID=UPI0009396998|nr:hypothetical protein [Streptomyces sp. TSRI0107]
MPTSALPVTPGRATGAHQGPRLAAAQFFAQARAAQAATTLPPLVDGDCASSPDGLEWWRRDGRWERPDRPGGPVLSDDVVAGWWEERARPDSRFALVHRLAAGEVQRITAPRYTSRFQGLSSVGGEFIREETVTGDQLRHLAAHAAVSPSSSAHLELPSGIVTLHSDIVGDVFFLPVGTGSRPAPAGRAAAVARTPRPVVPPADGEAVSWFGASETPDAQAAVAGDGADDGFPAEPPALPRRTVAGRQPPRGEP